MTKVGINGFGCNGRMVFRAALQHYPDIEVVGINDPLDPDDLAYMLQYDSVHGKFKGTVAVEGQHLVVNGKRFRLSAERNPASLLWNEVGAEVVVDCSCLPFNQELCEAHFKAGARKVVQCPGNATLATFSLTSLLGICISQSIPAAQVKSIILACESGIGSSLMIVNMLKKKLKAAQIEGVDIERMPIREVPPSAQVVLVHKSLADTVRSKAPDAAILTFKYPMNDPVFDQLVQALIERAEITSTRFDTPTTATGTSTPAASAASAQSSPSIPAARIKTILLACESGVGSSLMIVNLLKKKLKAAGIGEVEVERVPIREIPPSAQVVVVHKSLADAVRPKALGAAILTFKYPMNDPVFDQLVQALATGSEVSSTRFASK